MPFGPPLDGTSSAAPGAPSSASSRETQPSRRSSGTPSEASSGFDGLAAAYDRWYDTPVGRLVDQLEKDAGFALVEPQRGELVLDLSCGTGNSALALAQRGFRVVGVDVPEPMLLVARAKARRGGIALA